MIDRRKPNIGLEEVQAILSVLAKILARGLAAEQRETVLRDVPLRLDTAHKHDEYSFYRALFDLYDSNKNLNYVIDLTRRIEGTRSFYQDVGPDLDRLRYLLNSMKVGQAEAAIEPYVFVLMPFRQQHFMLYERAIKPALEELGCIVEHANEVNTVERIVDSIFTKIRSARFLVADTTGKNPNVFYELGYAHALGKKVILIVQDPKDIPFDVADLRHIVYKPQQVYTLCEDLRNVARTLLEAPAEAVLA
jgi:hypothetical protein